MFRFVGLNFSQSRKARMLARRVVFLSFLLVGAPALLAGGSGSSKKPLEGSYPIVLSHGILGFDDSQGLLGGAVKYWGGMDDYLRDQGAKVLTPGKTALEDVPVRAAQERDKIRYWMAANGFQKVNIIAHSQGAIDNRYMIANLGMRDKVAVLTTLNGVNHGTPIADIGTGLIPSWLEPFADSLVNFLGDLIYGDGQQDVMASLESLTIDSAGLWQAVAPAVSGVDYFSYGSAMSLPDPVQHPIMFIPHPITWAGGLAYGVGGANDGVVPLSSQKFGTWKGGPATRWYTTGVDHVQAINFEWTGELWYDVEAYYLKMAKNARDAQ